MELIIISHTKLKIMLSAPDMQYYELLPDHMSCIDEQTRRAFRHIFDDARSRVGFDTEGERLFVQLYTSRDGGCEIFVTKLGEAQSDFGGRSPFAQSAPLQTQDKQDMQCRLTPAEEALLRRVLAYDEDTSEGNTELSLPDADEDRDMENYEGISSTDTTPYDTSEEVSSPMDRHMNTPKKDNVPAGLTQVDLHPVVLSVPDMATLLSVCRRLLSLGYNNDSSAYIEDTSPTAYHLFLHVPDGGFYLLPEAYAFLKEYGDIHSERMISLYLSEHGKVICPMQAVNILGEL